MTRLVRTIGAAIYKPTLVLAARFSDGNRQGVEALISSHRRIKLSELPVNLLANMPRVGQVNYNQMQPSDLCRSVGLRNKFQLEQLVDRHSGHWRVIDVETPERSNWSRIDAGLTEVHFNSSMCVIHSTQGRTILQAPNNRGRQLWHTNTRWLFATLS